MDRSWLRLVIVFFAGGVLVAGAVNAGQELAQVAPSPTPVRVNIPTQTPLPTEGSAPTLVPATFTPTDQGPAQLEVRSDAGAVNVRSDASTDSDILGQIRRGDRYTVTGRYFRWLQFRFDPSPSGLGWVYDELVEIIGDETAIPDLSAIPTEDALVLNATQTAQVVELTPGFELTTTAEVRVIEAPSGDTVGAANPESTGEVNVLPTYTYPPNIVAQAPTDGSPEEVTLTPDPTGINITVAEGVAPIVPILVLGGLGIMGLLIMALRR